MGDMDRKKLYSTAYACYDEGLFVEASDIFTQLTLIDPQQEAYWFGLAASRQMEKKYKPALYAWGFAALLSKDDPLPHFHAAECLVSLNQKEEAKIALSAALECCCSEALSSRIEQLKEVCDAGH